MIRAVIKIRRIEGYTVKPEAEAMDGLEIDVFQGWLIEDGLYKGEEAWIVGPRDNRGEDDPAWFASGDLQFFRSVS